MIELVPEDKITTQKYYRKVPIKLREELGRKDPIRGRTTQGFCTSWNVLVHIALFVKVFSAKMLIPVLERSPYLRDINQCDFYMFPK